MIADLPLGQPADVRLRFTPCRYDDLGRLHHSLDLPDDGGLDLGSRNSPDRARVEAKPGPDRVEGDGQVAFNVVSEAPEGGDIQASKAGREGLNS